MIKAKVTCKDCGEERFTFSRAPRCKTCAAIFTHTDSRNRIKVALENLGHTDVEFKGFTASGKIGVSFLHPVCGTQQTWQASNITKVLKADPNTAPCSVCGAKRRTAQATIASALANGIPDHLLPEWDAYRRTVRRLSEQTYRLHKDTINPLNLKRGMTAHHLDHIVPIIEGFKNGIDASAIAHVSNLQMLSATENLSKGGRF